ncbi:MAG: helix-turn-helix transcriptional regulator [Paenibacillus sp.]|uniref:helix-turn-helix transcriptional regulator n=1 Tax=Paenibacillus sp. TaxID=58172 RepID=UPI0025FFC820|nr:AraC family transcriptional regulator [Paenibacillus sp.]MBR2565978.1 helix-turn-helix transcriptional regulator [Paenibacillus sp.]
MLAFRLTGQPDSRMPLYLYGVGTQEERGLHRPDGFPVYQLFLARGGGGQFIIPGKGTLVMGGGQMLALEPGIPHEYIPQSKVSGELAYIGIGGASVAPVLQAAGILREEPFTLSEFDTIWSRMTALWVALDQGKMSIWSTSVLIYELILDITRVMAEVVPMTGSEEAMQQNGVTSSRLQDTPDAGLEGLNRAIALMQTHYQDDLLLKHVANAVGYSVQHLNRLFHQHYGVTGHQYMQRWRLQKGLEWLNNHPQASVKEAAENVGMEVNYFIRMYKREFGETPGKGMKLRKQIELEQSPGHQDN